MEDLIITVYCSVDDTMKKLLKEQGLRQRGFGSKLTDEEMVTMEIVAESIGIDTDKGAWEYFCQHWRALFPRLGSRVILSEPDIAEYSMTCPPTVTEPANVKRIMVSKAI